MGTEFSDKWHSEEKVLSKTGPDLATLRLRDLFLVGLSVGLLYGLLNGGLAFLEHWVLRLLLWLTGSIPWNYPRFLDYAAERILLRKVGGGYTFIHQELLEYFASLDEESL